MLDQCDTKRSQLRSESCAGPPLPETLRLLAPLASKLEILNLGGNKLGGTITDDIAVFTKLTELGLYGMDLEGECFCVCVEAVPTQRADERNWGANSRLICPDSHGTFPARSCRRHPGVDRRAEQPADPQPLLQPPLGYVCFILCMFSAYRESR